MKSFKQIMEDINLDTNLVNFMSPSASRYLRDYFSKLSGAFQPNIKRVIEMVDTHLTKFGYTLNITPAELAATEMGDKDKILLAVHAFATKEQVKNCYITIEWTQLSSGQQFYFRSEALNISCNVLLHETTPQIFDTMLASYNQAEDGNGYITLPDKEDGHSYR